MNASLQTPDGNDSTSPAFVNSAPPRGYLYVTAAVTGAGILIVEILGAKMLAPYFGTSHFVWTGQIAVTLVALAAGYSTGGWWVDRSPHLGRMYAAIAVAALYLCLTVPALEPVSRWCLQFNLAVGSLVASAFLFFVPLGLLAMTVPFFVRVLTSSLGSVGGSVGRLTAISTVGSVDGVILIGYVLIPMLPNSITMLITAAVLLTLSVAYLAVRDRKTALFFSLAAVMGLSAGWLGAKHRTLFAEGVELFCCNSNFGMVQVVETSGTHSRFHRGTSRYYLNDYLIQNIYDPVERRSLLMSTYVLHDLPLAYREQVGSVLCIGMGVGMVPTEFARDGVTVDAVEINPALPLVADGYFDFLWKGVGVFIGDGRQYLHSCDRNYDTVILDAFLGDSIPSHLLTREAFAEIRRVLRPGGTVVIHSFGNLQPGKRFLVASVWQTLSDVFSAVRIHHDESEPGVHSVFFIASDKPLPGFVRIPEFDHVAPNCVRQVRAVFGGTGPSRFEDGTVLTDDFNPVDFHDAANREAIRRIIVADADSL